MHMSPRPQIAIKIIILCIHVFKIILWEVYWIICVKLIIFCNPLYHEIVVNLSFVSVPRHGEAIEGT